ncbi:xanthine dehydrogenase family protein molybdopterin-binding subunit [Natrinema gelatinilyticum]|uniref:xanthine dehydrogenase family protein molybdopterin-binding subunit n=1 Tax=Natrinema gelatinilyticum TaxID=2961571 RepID=UPI0020C2CC8F|nr:xanthine dehydrogenase family protein molybdopterin-binding subunit [Natrinema gelatinilyticum]
MSGAHQATEDEEFTTVGESIERADGVEKITGTAEFTYDVEFPNMLWTSFVKSPYAHARIEDIDTSAAEELDGVHAVLTQADFPDERFGDGLLDQTCLADEKALFEGHYVAVVAAESRRLADEATQLVDVEYDQLEPVVDGEEAFKTDPPEVIHPDLFEYETSDVLPPTLVEDRPNVYQNYTVGKGDVGEGFEEADHIYEDTYRTAPIQHAPMEPHMAVARPEGDGELTIWTSCQAVHKIQHTTAAILNKPARKVRAIEPYVGGGFGGKESPLLEPIAGRLADVTGRPVKVVHSREEEFKNATISGEVKTEVKTGVTDDGDIVAREVSALLPGGGYASTGFMVARNCTFGIANSYDIPHIDVDTYGVYTNTPVSGSFRGFGNRQVLFGLESQIDKIARDLGMDPIEFRKRNLLEEGDITAFNERRQHVSADVCLETLEEEFTAEKDDADDPWVTGVGSALVNKYSLAPTASSATVKVHPDGSVELRYSSDEIGQGSTTAMSQIVAQEFDVDVEDVEIVRADTDVTPFDQGSISSRSTFNMGNAVRMACDDAKEELFEQAADVLEIPPEELETSRGRVYPEGDPDHGIEIEDVFTKAIYESGYFLQEGGEIIGKDTWHVEAGDPEEGKVGRVNSFYSEGAAGVKARVNTRTGEVELAETVGVFDVGKAINPKLVEEQITGAFSMGIGAALYEKMEYDPETGRTINANYSDYKIPSIHEHPMDIKPIYLEESHPEGPYGAKGIGEAPTVAIIPAIATAIRDAVGTYPSELPMLPENVYSLANKEQP